MGLMLEYSSNFCLSVTATLLGAFGIGIVVVGPLKQALVSPSNFIVYSGMYVESRREFFSHCSDPASHKIISVWVLHDFNTCNIASTISGPMPSPFIIAAFFPKTCEIADPVYLTLTRNFHDTSQIN